MISTPDRRRIITLINEAVEAGARLIKACGVLNLSMRIIQRWRRSDGSVPEDARLTGRRPTSGNKLTDAEPMRILQTINQPEFANLSPGGIVPTLADRDLFIGSETTMYRLMREVKPLCQRGKAHWRTHNLTKTLTAYDPNEVWCWDITCMRVVAKGYTF